MINKQRKMLLKLDYIISEFAKANSNNEMFDFVTVAR